MKRLTAAQKHGRRMRAKGRDCRGGFTRQEQRRGEHRKRTCGVRGCTNRFDPDDGQRDCPTHRDDGDDDGAADE